jgi:hypothetical protein
MAFQVTVTDKETKLTSWIEIHKSRAEALKAIADIKENHFNPNFFDYSIKEIK